MLSCWHNLYLLQELHAATSTESLPSASEAAPTSVDSEVAAGHAGLPATTPAEESVIFTPLDLTHASLDTYEGKEERVTGFGTSAMELLPHEGENVSSRVLDPVHMADRLV